MTHKIISVKPTKNFILLVVFQNGIEKSYDVRKVFSIFPQFKIFERNTDLFYQVKVDIGGYGVSWNDDLDLNAEDIWEGGIGTGVKKELDIVTSLAESLLQARTHVGMTQKQLAESTGIYQADISKIERGLANPSLNTLKRLSDGMGLKLKIEFIF